MSTASLSSRAIIGEYFARLEQAVGLDWVQALSRLFTSDQLSEDYKWLGQSPAMREWIGGRHAKGFSDNSLTIKNIHYEATLEVDVDDLRRDKTGQVLARIAELADRTNAHWASLLSTLIGNGDSTVCYDGQFYFDTDHTEGENTTNQDNDITVDISALAVSNAGTITAPSVGEMQQVILKGIQQILSFLDNQSEPMNENASNFMVFVPTPLWSVARAAVSSAFIDQGETNVLVGSSDLSLTVHADARSSWTDEFAVFRTDSSMPPFIRQEEKPVAISAIAEGSEHEFKNNEHIYGVDTWRNVGYGYWQYGCLVKMT